MDQFIEIFQEVINLYKINNKQIIDDANADKNKNMIKFLKLKTTPARIAKKKHIQK